jgi:hypothetical protein
VAASWGLTLRPQNLATWLQFPTSNMPTDDFDASDATDKVSEGTTSETQDDIESHPKFQELQKKYAASRQGMDKTNISRKQLQSEIARLKVLAGEEETPEEEVSTEPQYVTKEQLQEEKWELLHTKDIEIYGDEEYADDLKNGIPRDYALKTAKLRYQSNPDKARLDRQKANATGSTSTRNLESADLEGFNPEEAKKWGYSKETFLKHKQMKKEQGR